MPRHGVFLPPFNEWAEPARLVELAVAAEGAGWDGFFLWDHVLRRPEQASDVADPWISLAAIAVATERLRLGTMVTPPVRRRPQVLARQVATLDRLSGGRVVLGLGLGVDTTGELSLFGEIVDPRLRGELLDEAVPLLASFLAGERVDHDGNYFTARHVQLLPACLQSPRVPIWLGAEAARSRPVRRAAHYEGLFLIRCTPEQVRRGIDLVAAERGGLAGFDVAVLSDCGLDEDGAARAGVTWRMLPVRPEWPVSRVEAAVAAGPIA